MKDIIRLGDPTTHGGVVLEAFFQTNLNGKPIAGVGHKVSCPLCKGVFPIAEVAVALDGMKTACGAQPDRQRPERGCDQLILICIRRDDAVPSRCTGKFRLTR